jgi:hypothetical protein
VARLPLLVHQQSPTCLIPASPASEPEAAPEPAASSASAPAAAAGAGGAVAGDEEETVFYEGSGSDAELALSILLGFTLICLVSCPASLCVIQAPRASGRPWLAGLTACCIVT